jgi:hypothetical protein
MSTTEVPNEAACRKFVDKLDQFRGSLDQDEQRMLDALIAGARKAHAQGDVEIYWFTSGLSGSDPVPLGDTTEPLGDTTDVWSGYAGGQGSFQNTPFS